MKFYSLVCVLLVLASCKEEKDDKLNYGNPREVVLRSEALKITNKNNDWVIYINSTSSGVSIETSNQHGQVITHSSYNDEPDATHLTFNTGLPDRILSFNFKGNLVIDGKEIEIVIPKN